MLYSIPQLRLLILLALALLAGLGVREWRAGFPDAAERLERFDQDEAPTPLLTEAPPTPAAAPAPAPRSPAPRSLDVNRADAAELARLPGVGPGLARRIVEERERRGRFESPEALRYVPGLGPKKLAAIRHLITVRE